MNSSANLYCFEIAVDSIYLHGESNSILGNSSCLSFQFLQFPQVILIPNLLNISGTSYGKACYFTIDSDKLAREIERNGFIILSIIDYSVPSTIALAKILVETLGNFDCFSNSGVVQLRTENNKIFAELQVGFRLFKVGDRVNSVSYPVQKLTRSQFAQTTSDEERKINQATASVQTSRQTRKAKQCQTLHSSKRSTETQTAEENPKNGQFRSTPLFENDFLSVFGTLLKTNLVSKVKPKPSRRYPMLSVLSQELEKLVLENDIQAIAREQKSKTTRNIQSGPYVGLTDWSSPVSKNLYSRIYASKSVGYAVNRATLLRESFGQHENSGDSSQPRQRRKAFTPAKIYLRDAATSCDAETTSVSQKTCADREIQTDIPKPTMTIAHETQTETSFAVDGERHSKRRSSKGTLWRRQWSTSRRSVSVPHDAEREILNTSLMIEDSSAVHPRQPSLINEYSSDFSSDDESSSKTKSLETIKTEESGRRSAMVRNEKSVASDTAKSLSTASSIKTGSKKTVLDAARKSKSASQASDTNFSSVSSEFLPENADQLAASQSTNDLAASLRLSNFSHQKNLGIHQPAAAAPLSPVSKYLADLRGTNEKPQDVRPSVHTESVSSYRPSDFSSSFSPDRPVF